MKKFFRKTLAIALVAAAVGTTGIMPGMTADAASAATQISAEVANSSFSVAFKEAYTTSTVFKDQVADDKFQSVTISAIEKFRLAVYNTKTFKTTDKITVYRSKTEKGSYSVARTVTPTASDVCFITLKQTPGTTMYYSVEVTDSKGTVKYAQRYKVTMADEEIGNNKYTYELRTTTKENDTSSYQTRKLNVSKADNKQPVIKLLDTQRFYFDIKNVPDGYYLDVEADSLSFKNEYKETYKYSRVRSSNGVITFSDYIYKGDAKSFKFMLRDISGNTVMCARYKFVGAEVPTTMRTHIIYSYDGGEERNVYQTTDETKVEGDTSLVTKDFTTYYNSKLHSVYVPVYVSKDGGIYNDSETVKFYLKESAAKSYGEPVKTLTHATTSDYYRTYIKLPKAGTDYDIKAELYTQSGKVLAQEFTKVNASITSSVGIYEAYTEMSEEGKLNSKTKSIFLNSGDVLNPDPIEFPVYSSTDTRYNGYNITVGGMGDPAAVYRIYVRQNGTERLAFEQSNMTSAGVLTLKQLGVTPKAGTSADIIIRSYNASGAKLSQWTRTIKFVEPRMFKLNLKFTNEYSNYVYGIEKELTTDVKAGSDTKNITDRVVYNRTFLTLEAKYNETYKGTPGNVIGTVYIRKAGEKTSTKLCALSECMQKGLSGKTLPTFCSLCNYSLTPDATYTLSVKLYNKDTKTTFYTTAVTFKYLSTVG